jgi:hypothetical protein
MSTEIGGSSVKSDVFFAESSLMKVEELLLDTNISLKCCSKGGSLPCRARMEGLTVFSVLPRSLVLVLLIMTLARAVSEECWTTATRGQLAQVSVPPAVIDSLWWRSVAPYAYLIYERHGALQPGAVFCTACISVFKKCKDVCSYHSLKRYGLFGFIRKAGCRGHHVKAGLDIACVVGNDHICVEALELPQHFAVQGEPLWKEVLIIFFTLVCARSQDEIYMAQRTGRGWRVGLGKSLCSPFPHGNGPIIEVYRGYRSSAIWTNMRTHLMEQCEEQLLKALSLKIVALVEVVKASPLEDMPLKFYS